MIFSKERLIRSPTQERESEETESHRIEYALTLVGWLLSGTRVSFNMIKATTTFLAGETNEDMLVLLLCFWRLRLGWTDSCSS